MASLQASTPITFTPLFINGEHKSSSTNTTFSVINPYSNEVVGLSASASSQDCQDAIESAGRAFETWENTSHATRRDIFLKAADIASSERYKKKIMEAMASETAATPSFGAFNWAPTATALRTTAALVNELKGETFPSTTGGTVMVQRKATGVVYGSGLITSKYITNVLVISLGIAPWNAPFSLSLRAVAIPIICGNTVVLKCSEYSPRSQAIVAELFQEVKPLSQIGTLLLTCSKGWTSKRSSQLYFGVS